MLVFINQQYLEQWELTGIKYIVPPARDDWAIIRLIAGKPLKPNIPNNGGNARYGWSNDLGMVKSARIGLSSAAKLPSVKCVQRLSEN